MLGTWNLFVQLLEKESVITAMKHFCNLADSATVFLNQVYIANNGSRFKCCKVNIGYAIYRMLPRTKTMKKIKPLLTKNYLLFERYNNYEEFIKSKSYFVTNAELGSINLYDNEPYYILKDTDTEYIFLLYSAKLAIAIQQSYSNKYCASCKHFIGGGDFGTCCSKKYDLVYANTVACAEYEIKNT